MNLSRMAIIAFSIYTLLKKASNSVLDNITWTFGKFSLKKDVKLLKEELTFRLLVTNNNEFPIPITRISGTVSHAGVQLGKVDSSKFHELRPGVVTIIEMTMHYLSEDMVQYITGFLTGDIDRLAPFVIDLKIQAEVKGKTFQVPVKSEIIPLA